MQFGIDFGTTRTIVTSVDRGNYPVVSFTDASGDTHDHIPSVVARVGDGLVFGFEALDAATRGAPLVRSFKRELAAGSVNPSTTVDIGGLEVGLLDLVTQFLASVRTSILGASNLAETVGADEVLEAVVAVPAHAHSAQRFLTLEAFRGAGFTVTALLNEPSAAGFEFTHRQARTLNRKRTRVIVYDLGGGTFDASLVRVDERSHEVVSSIGVNRLGGDDFDQILASLAESEVGGRVRLTERQRFSLLDECRVAKENLSPQSRRIALEVGHAPVVVTVEDFYAAAAPLVAQSLEAMAPLVGGLEASHLESAGVAGIYLVGGGSGLPLVARVLRERFGRRVHRSPYPAVSTAIGLAIAADASAGYSLTDRLSRGFGVFREGDAGTTLQFDPILDRNQILTEAPIVVTRRYRPVHNVGVFRFVEYARVGEQGEPTGDVTPLGEVLFPFDPALRDGRDLRHVTVEQRGHGPLIEERYVIDQHGIVEASVTDLESGYTQQQALGA